MESLLRNENSGRLRDIERRLIHIKPNQRNKLISKYKDDGLIQTWRERADDFLSKCSRIPQQGYHKKDSNKDGSRESRKISQHLSKGSLPV